MSDTLQRAWKLDSDKIAELAEQVGALVQAFNNAVGDFRSLTRYSHDDAKNVIKPNWSGEFVRYEDVLKLLERLKK